MSKRWIVVDDSDPRIRYTRPSWIGAGDTGGLSNGPIYNGTVHGANSTGGLSFSFEGSSAKIWGSTSAFNLPDVSSFVAMEHTSWQCFVDQISVYGTVYLQPSSAGNNILLCDTQSLTDGMHELTLNVVSTDRFGGNSSVELWVDYIHYLPSQNVSETTAPILVENNDPEIIYGTGWSSGLPGDNSTSSRNLTTSVTNGSELTFNFTGSGLTWVGTLSYPNSTSASYSIDSGTPVNFTVTGVPAKRFNEVLFSTPELPPGQHSLRVVHGNNTAPLTLDHFIVANISSPSGPNSSSSLPTTPLPTSPSATSRSNKTLTGVIVGAAVGGAFLIILTVLLLLFWRRRRRRAGHASDALERQLGSSPLITSQHLPSAAGLQIDDTSESRAHTSDYTHSPPAPGAPFDLSLSTANGNGGETYLVSQAIGLQGAKLVRLEYVHQPVVHQDSGVRFQQVADEVPPGYTAT